MIPYRRVISVLPAMALTAARRVSSTSFANLSAQKDAALPVKSDKQEVSMLKSYLKSDELLSDDIDWGRAMEVIRETEGQLPPVDKAQLHQQLSVLNPTFSLATLVNENPTLQKLVDLGVDLSDWEESYGVEGSGLAVSLDFDTDVAPRIHLLVDLGVNPDDLGHIFTQGGPDLFRAELDSLRTRVDYLKWKKFSSKAIVRILTDCPQWLTHSVTDIDRRLGYFQKAFALSGDEVRSAATRGSQLMVWDGVHMAVERVRLLLEKDQEFSHGQVKRILLKAPEVFMNWDETEVGETCLALGQMYSREVMLAQPGVLALSKHDVRIRNEFLKFLGKSRYDPERPNFVPPRSLLADDETFCKKYAKVPVEVYNKFLLTV